MKKFDKDGLILAKMQGEMFLKSKTKLNCSTEIFIRRFVNSEVSSLFDNTSLLDTSYSIDDLFILLNDEYKESNYGKIKYNDETLYWIGYLYRYFSYTYELSSKQVYSIIKPKELKDMYYIYHTYDPSKAIEEILEIKHISFKEEDYLMYCYDIYKKVREGKL